VNRVVVPLSGLLVILSTIAFSAAQSAKHAAKGADPDESAIHDFILTMDKVNQYAAVSKTLQASAAGDPVMAAEMKKVEETDVPNVERAALIEKSPHTAASLKANGITAREFVLIPMTVVTAAIAVAALDAKGKPPAFVNPVNIQFVRNHRAELEKLELSGSSNSRDENSDVKDSEDKDNH
jgi:hypothetical protein